MQRRDVLLGVRACGACGLVGLLLLSGCKHVPRGDVSLPLRSHDVSQMQERADGDVISSQQGLPRDVALSPDAILPHEVTLPDGTVAQVPHAQKSSAVRFALVQEALLQDMEATPPAWVVELLQYDATLPEPYPPSQDVLARMALEGDGVPQNSANAFNLALDAARQGYAPSQVLVATLYTTGHGTARDPEQAFHWLREAARAEDAAHSGEPEAMIMLADAYRQGVGVAKDMEEAFLWTYKAAQMGNPRAQWWLGLHYYYGMGIPKDGAQAMVFLRPFADMGDTESQRCVGILAYEGRGVEQNFALAAQYLRLAAKAHDREALLYLGVILHKGQGFASDMPQSRQCFFEGAMLGEPRCMSLLATMLELGEGGAVDKVAAYAWYSLARQYGDTAAAPFISALHTALTAQERAEAEALVLRLQADMGQLRTSPAFQNQ